MADGFLDKAKFTGTRTGTGPVTGWVRVPPYRLPTDVKAIGDRVFLETRDVNDDTLWEHAWYEIGAGGQLTVYLVVDTHARAGEYVPGVPPAAISFGGPVEVGAIANSVTIPVIGPDGRLLNGKAVRDSVIFPDIVTLQARDDLADGDIFFTFSSLYTPSGGGPSTGAGPGLLLQYDIDSAAAPNGVTVFDLSSGAPGRLIKASLEIQAEFIRNQWSIYADGSGVSRLKSHALARGAAGADAAWQGFKVQRGSDGAGAYTELLSVDNDRHAGLETPFTRLRSYGGADDYFEAVKPLKLPVVAAKANVRAGLLAGVATSDGRIWYNHPTRGFGEIPLQEGPFRAIATNVADLRNLTPDGYRDGEVVLVAGSTFRGDESFEVMWASASAAADNSTDVFKPTLHANGDPWVEPGRFIAVAPIRAIKFANSDATPSVAGSGVFTAPDVAPPAGITAFDEFRNNKRIKLQPGAVDVVIVQANGALELPGRSNFVLRSIANGGSPVIFEKENGVVTMIGGGEADAAFNTIAALKAASPVAGSIAAVRGYATAGDGGHNSFLVLAGDAASNGYANTLDGVIFENTAASRTFVTTARTNRMLFERIGIFGSASAAANGAAWAAAIAYVDAVNQGANFVVGEGTYGFDRALSVTDIVGVTFTGQGKDRSVLSFTGATNTNGIEFIGASWFGGVFDLQVTGADYSGIVIDAGGANPAANNFHITIRDCELTLNGRHGFQCDEGFMLDLVNTLSQSNGWDGFYIEGFTTTLTAHTCWALSNGRNGGAAATINGLSGHYGNGWTLNDIQYSTLIGCGSDDNGNDVSGTGFGYFITNCATLSLINCGAETSRNSGIAMWANSTIAAGASFSLFSVRNIKIAGFQGVNNNTAEATRVSYNAGAGAGQFPFGTTGAGLIEARSTGTTAHFVKAIAEQCELLTTGASPAMIVDGAKTDITYIGPTPNGGFSIVNSGKLHQHDAYNDLFQWRVNDKPLFTVGRIGGTNLTVAEADATYQEIRGDVYSGGAAFHGTYDTRRRARGTKAAPTAVVGGDTIAAQDMFGHDGTSFVRCGQIGFSVSGTVSTGVVPGSWALSLADAAGVLTQRMSVTPAGIGSFVGPWRVGSFTVAGVPAAGTAGAGAIIYVSNESGGAVLAFSDGASWRRVTDRAIIS